MGKMISVLHEILREKSEENEQFLLKQASEAMAAITEKVNNFIRTEWPEYQKAIEDADLSAFKAIEPIEN